MPNREGSSRVSCRIRVQSWQTTIIFVLLVAMDLDSLDFDKVADERVAGSDALMMSMTRRKRQRVRNRSPSSSPSRRWVSRTRRLSSGRSSKNFGSGGAKPGKASFWLAVACPKTLCTLLLPPRRWPSSHGYWGQRRGADAYHAIRQIL